MTAWDDADRPKIRRPARLKYDHTRQSDILLLPERVVVLNETAGAILRLCDGHHTIADIIRQLEAQYQQSGLEADVQEFLRSAAEKGWVEAWKPAPLTP